MFFFSYIIFKYGWGRVSSHASHIYPFAEILFRSHKLNKLMAMASAHLESAQSSSTSPLDLSDEIVLIKSSRDMKGKYPEIGLIQRTVFFFVLVSFGRECYPSMENIEEIANGLERRKGNFIWVIRFSAQSTGTVAEKVPKGFLRGLKIQG
ncbi:hypothetical protein M9H77_07553 [Catharanthus roseus]|uniref:Uncharacterized protein n=1 Tax=Catharanthus roseus TaxID=4058 RepID=A0ACC0BVN3_CATRO|nr:hypothetical protein M9H77_07553 [Catharanthus roseus]